VGFAVAIAATLAPVNWGVKATIGKRNFTLDSPPGSVIEVRSFIERTNSASGGVVPELS
jgi:hypothetical protein